MQNSECGSVFQLFRKKLNIAIYSKEGKNMDISFAGFCQQVLFQSCSDGNGSAHFGRDICKRVDRCAERDRHMYRYKMSESKDRDPDECLCLISWECSLWTHINSAVASTISNMVDFGGQTEEALIALCAALFSIVVYSVAASVFGIPTSERPQSDRRTYRCSDRYTQRRRRCQF